MHAVQLLVASVKCAQGHMHLCLQCVVVCDRVVVARGPNRDARSGGRFFYASSIAQGLLGST